MSIEVNVRTPQKTEIADILKAIAVLIANSKSDTVGVVLHVNFYTAGEEPGRDE